MTGKPATVSVVMPAKNAAAHIGEAIASVLLQGHGVEDLIVIDDGSTDATRVIVGGFDDPRVRLLSNPGRGVSSARNHGASAAGGDWLMFLDSDDRLRPGAIATLLQAANAAQRAVAIYGDYDRIDGNGAPIGRRGWLQRRSKPSGEVLQRLAAGNFIVNGGVMIVRADAFAAVGGFDAALKYCEDWHCWCRLAALGEFQAVKHQLLDYRVHGDSTMSPSIRSPADFLPAVDRVFGDAIILAKLPPASMSGLRRAAEIHMMTYAATQAVRFGRYRQAGRYALAAIRRSPRATPAVALRLGLAWLRI
ncbi:glycosyltransferase [Rhodopseudomonas palustris]|uniref:glycosyltransferase n=1 Tax=Rhodopseudomonas palustris TaxID=1076 RepID=UPI0002FD7188